MWTQANSDVFMFKSLRIFLIIKYIKKIYISDLWQHKKYICILGFLWTTLSTTLILFFPLSKLVILSYLPHSLPPHRCSLLVALSSHVLPLLSDNTNRGGKLMFSLVVEAAAPNPFSFHHFGQVNEATSAVKGTPSFSTTELRDRRAPVKEAPTFFGFGASSSPSKSPLRSPSPHWCFKLAILITVNSPSPLPPPLWLLPPLPSPSHAIGSGLEVLRSRRSSPSLTPAFPSLCQPPTPSLHHCNGVLVPSHVHGCGDGFSFLFAVPMVEWGYRALCKVRAPLRRHGFILVVGSTHMFIPLRRSTFFSIYKKRIILWELEYIFSMRMTCLIKLLRYFNHMVAFVF